MSKSISNGSDNPLGLFFPKELRRRMSEDLHLTGKFKRTHDCYIRAVRQLSDFAQCSPDKVSETQVHSLITATTKLRMFVYFWTVYTMGLRLGRSTQLTSG